MKVRYVKRSNFLTQLGEFTGAFMGAFVASRENQIALYAEAAAINAGVQERREHADEPPEEYADDVKAHELIEQIVATNFSGVTEPELHTLRMEVSSFLTRFPDYSGIHESPLHIFALLAEDKDIPSLKNLVKMLEMAAQKESCGQNNE